MVTEKPSQLMSNYNGNVWYYGLLLPLHLSINFFFPFANSKCNRIVDDNICASHFHTPYILSSLQRLFSAIRIYMCHFACWKNSLYWYYRWKYLSWHTYTFMYMRMFLRNFFFIVRILMTFRHNIYLARGGKTCHKIKLSYTKQFRWN